MLNNNLRCAEWGNWGLTFFVAKSADNPRDADYFCGSLPFPVGPQGPMDGYIGSKERLSFTEACAQWQRDGILPDGCICHLDQKWLFASSLSAVSNA